MLRSRDGRRDPFHIALFVTAVLSLLPVSALGWVSDLAGILVAIRTPFTVVVQSASAWLRPPHDPISEFPVEIQQLTEQLDIALAAHAAARSEIERLKEQISELQAAREFNQGGTFQPLVARVVPLSARQDGSVSLDVGSRYGVSPGDVAVHRGVYLLGRVGPDVGAVSSTLIPLIHPTVRFLDCIVTSAANSQAPLTRLQLTPAGEGMFQGDISDDDPVAVGDTVRLADDTWSPGAQGMIVGKIDFIARKDEAPKRLTVTVRPHSYYRLTQLSTVTLKLPEDAPRTEEPQSP